MVAIGFGVIWAGYLQLIYGYTLLKGYDIRWRDLANPIHPYQWPKPGTKIPTVPAGQILPGQTASSATAGMTAGTNPAVPPAPVL